MPRSVVKSRPRSALPAVQHRLSWNEIRRRAVKFSKEFAGVSKENAEAQTFWNGFFDVFGLSRKRLASFEVPAIKQDGRDGRIDLLWKQVLMVEHKSRGHNLDAAVQQAFEYFPGLADRDLPQYVLVSDFARLRLHDLEGSTQFEFALKDLHKEVRRFGFMVGYQTQSYGEQDPVNVKAAERLGNLHDLLRESGYEGHPLEKLLVRLLFCLFADDTGLFERRTFQDLIEQRTSLDGADLGHWLADLFQVLDTPVEKRQKKLDEDLAAFPWVNGRLFEEALPIAAFDGEMREALLTACSLDWSRISPAIFGSLFQSILETEARRELGAHYTSETNILKALRPLFLDELDEEFNRIKRSRKQLVDFHQKLANIRILDPACGCGNFLVIAYRELRLLEMKVLGALFQSRLKKGMEEGLSIDEYLLLDVDQFYGIEYEEFPAQIAQVALWLMDHQMNLLAGEEFGQLVSRLPLKKFARITNANALQIDWRKLVDPTELTYIVGNPPFVGVKHMNQRQRADVALVFGGRTGTGRLDYVTCWYDKAMDMLDDNPVIRAAFVSTNSITQGEQPGVLWPSLLQRGLRIQFAHRTFEWTSESRGKAAVHCVIVGFGKSVIAEKRIFDYKTPKSDQIAVKASNINPYLVDGPDVVVHVRTCPICPVAKMQKGNEATDDGHLILSKTEMEALLQEEPAAKPWIRPFLGCEDFLNGGMRWCLWLDGISPDQLRSMPAVLRHVERVRAFRLASTKRATRDRASTSWLFGENRQPEDGRYILVPKVSSVSREYVPVGLVDHMTIINNTVQFIRGANLFHLGVLQSEMHMAWLRAVGGRMKSDYQYSIKIVYNNFPWPSPAKAKRTAVERAAQGVLDTRAEHPGATLADLYDPRSMPSNLRNAHTALDRAVDRAYGAPRFSSEAKRVAFLFERYEELRKGSMEK